MITINERFKGVKRIKWSDIQPLYIFTKVKDRIYLELRIYINTLNDWLIDWLKCVYIFTQLIVNISIYIVWILEWSTSSFLFNIPLKSLNWSRLFSLRSTVSLWRCSQREPSPMKLSDVKGKENKLTKPNSLVNSNTVIYRKSLRRKSLIWDIRMKDQFDLIFWMNIITNSEKRSFVDENDLALYTLTFQVFAR